MLFFFSVEFGLQALEGDLQQPARQAAALMDRLLLWQVSQDYHADDIMDPAVASSHTIPCCGLDKNLCKFEIGKLVRMPIASITVGNLSYHCILYRFALRLIFAILLQKSAPPPPLVVAGKSFVELKLEVNLLFNSIVAVQFSFLLQFSLAFGFHQVEPSACRVAGGLGGVQQVQTC